MLAKRTRVTIPKYDPPIAVTGPTNAFEIT
jgi:hypothetical protein